MGNKPLSIGLKVNTEGPHPAGSIVYGTVYLSAPKKPQMAQSLQLRVIGKEELVVHHSTQQQQDNHHQGHEGHGRNHRRSNHHQSRNNNSRHHHHESETRHYYERSTHDILQMEYPLRIFPDGKVPVGQYEFPFALQLPSNIPSTMSCRKGQSSCEVKFEIMAELYQQPPSLLHTNPHSKQELIVEASTDISPRHDTSFALPAEMIPVTGCCCSKNGYVSLETKFDKTTIPVVSTTTNTLHNNNSSSNNRNHQDNPLASNTFSVDFRCQNKSTVTVDRIRLQLIETIEWASNGYQEQVKTVLAKVDVDAQQFRELDKLRKRDLRRLQRREYFGLTNNNNDNGDMLTLQHQPWHTIGPVQVPRYAKDSYHGRAIQIRHVLIVELITTGCCISNPDASTIVQIYRRLAEPPQHDHDFQDGDDNGGWATIPSAPLEDATSSLSPSAPSEFYDEPHSSTTSVFAEGTTPVVVSSSDVLVVEAQALPPDWHAETAEIVTIPMAEAILLGPTTPSTSSSRRVTTATTTTPWST